MFLTLLLVTLLVAAGISCLVVRLFGASWGSILSRIIDDAISDAWLKYLKFAVIIIGISSGVRIHELEKYITPARWDKNAELIKLTSERWVIEVYRTVIDTLQGIAWLLLVFFVFALIAYVIVRFTEQRRAP
ncbi:hypothetical protein ED236_01450 [Pseudomethylobacillus aquaticus]|uniref:Uncharacterized protein n=1 Tax=Pseudomethylobacillus aquaticus TaxID=2676064 RepID=A0A3N0V5T2_9PROT|nr:hypothetical protein [Pseudomethylobacillus aquaticus]ROH88167.1 hypothetical protein ED236_01450 [Pseudomethylobacillus aquaticus]